MGCVRKNAEQYYSEMILNGGFYCGFDTKLYQSPRKNRRLDVEVDTITRYQRPFILECKIHIDMIQSSAEL